MVLLYHRVSERKPDFDPWQLTVSKATFTKQMQILSETRRVVSLAEFVSDLKAKILDPKSICVTFDDGYVDNLREAKPILKKYGIPATIFIATDFLDEDNFWWDRLSHLLEQSINHPSRLARLKNELSLFNVDENVASIGHLLRALWLHFRDKNRVRCHNEILNLERDLDVDPLPVDVRPMTRDELVDLNDDLIQVASHTGSHAWLPEIPSEEGLNHELERPRELLRKILGYSPKFFAYPYGASSHEARNAVSRAGYEAAFTTVSMCVDKSTDLYAIPRRAVGDSLEDFY